MKRCYDIARLALGYTSPNPNVGSIIVYNDRIIGEGWHKRYGTAHAEVNAFMSIEKGDESLIRKSSIFVSLEPCFHFGKTAPCVNLLLDKNIPIVHIAFQDPNPKVEGKSIEKLKNEHIQVFLYESETTHKEINKLQYNQILKPFFTNIRHKRPYIILKWAESADGYIGKEGEKVQISNELSKRLVHKWRSEADGILVGTNTVLIDNPDLTNRYFYGKSPVRIVLDKNNIISKNYSIFNGLKETWVYTNNTIHANNDISYIKIDFENNMINNLLSDLFSKNIGILFIEGGAKVLHSFIKSDMWDEARVIKSEKILRGGIPAPVIPSHLKVGKEQLDDNIIDFYLNKK